MKRIVAYVLCIVSVCAMLAMPVYADFSEDWEFSDFYEYTNQELLEKFLSSDIGAMYRNSKMFFADKNYLALTPGEEASVRVTFRESGSVSFYNEHVNVVDPEWSEWNGENVMLMFVGKEPGISKVTVSNSENDDIFYILVIVSEEPLDVDSVTASVSKGPSAKTDGITYRSDGMIDTQKDEKGIVWTYYYKNGKFLYRTATMYAPFWKYGDKRKFSNGFTAYPAVFEDPIENCVGINISFELTEVTSGSTGSEFVVYVDEPEKSSSMYTDEGHIPVKKGQEQTYDIEINGGVPTTVKALCLRPYTQSAYSYSSWLDINSVTVKSYSYDMK